jgi:hypothetical protein
MAIYNMLQPVEDSIRELPYVTSPEGISQLIHVNFDLDTGGSKIVDFEPDETNEQA